MLNFNLFGSFLNTQWTNPVIRCCEHLCSGNLFTVPSFLDGFIWPSLSEIRCLILTYSTQGITFATFTVKHTFLYDKAPEFENYNTICHLFSNLVLLTWTFLILYTLYLSHSSIWLSFGDPQTKYKWFTMVRKYGDFIYGEPSKIHYKVR